MYVDDTSILNIPHNVNELQKPTSQNIGLAEKYFEANILSIYPTKTHYSLFQTKQCRQKIALKT
jgi:hypothetical protein